MKILNRSSISAVSVTVVAGGHVTQVAAVVAHVEAGVLPVLTHPGVGLLAGLVVGDGEGLGGVDLTSKYFIYFSSEH